MAFPGPRGSGSVRLPRYAGGHLRCRIVFMMIVVAFCKFQLGASACSESAPADSRLWAQNCKVFRNEQNVIADRSRVYSWTDANGDENAAAAHRKMQVATGPNADAQFVTAGTCCCPYNILHDVLSAISTQVHIGSFHVKSTSRFTSPSPILLIFHTHVVHAEKW